MSHNEMVNCIVADLKMGYDLALLVNNDILKDYVKNRLKDVKENQEIYQLAEQIKKDFYGKIRIILSLDWLFLWKNFLI